MKFLDASVYAYFNSLLMQKKQFDFLGTVIVLWLFIHKNALDVNHVVLVDEFGLRKSWRKQNRDYPFRITSRYSLSSFLQSITICAHCMQDTVLDAQDTMMRKSIQSPQAPGVYDSDWERDINQSVEQHTEIS